MRVRGFGRWLLRILLAGVLAVGAGYLPYRVYGPEGLARALRLERDLTRIEDGSAELRRENRELRQQIHRLKSDRSYLERVARDELGLVRPGDIVFQFPW